MERAKTVAVTIDPTNPQKVEFKIEFPVTKGRWVAHTIPVALILGVLALILLVSTTKSLHEFSAGTATTATVTGSYKHRNASDCEARDCGVTWSINGVSHDAEQIMGVPADGSYRVGSTLAVHVTPVGVFTERAVRVLLALGVGFLVVSIGMLAALICVPLFNSRPLGRQLADADRTADPYTGSGTPPPPGMPPPPS